MAVLLADSLTMSEGRSEPRTDPHELKKPDK
jgi:hypothetical protein